MTTEPAEKLTGQTLYTGRELHRALLLLNQR
jgi:hypothetical protein